MNIELKLSELDEKQNKSDINALINDIEPIMSNFFKNYNIEIVSIEYNSLLTHMFEKTEITFVTTISKGLYPDVKINISDLGKSYLKPSERIFRGVFFMKGLSNEFADKIYSTEKISRLIFVEDKNKSPINKIKKIIKLAKKEGLDKWTQYDIANNIFMF